jgi:short-subunit dehydrogenase
VARPSDKLNQTTADLSAQYDVEATAIGKDLAVDGAAQEVYNEVKELGITIDVLVNNAGQGTYGNFWEIKLEDHIKIIHSNVIALTTLTILYTREMVARNEGKILNLASVVSELPAPLQAVYSGTKAYILNFTEAIINELKDTNVTVTALQPGLTATDFFRKAGNENMKMLQDKSNAMDPADVAKVGYDALMAGKDKVVAGFKNKVQVAMANILPDTMVAENLRKQSEPVDK